MNFQKFLLPKVILAKKNHKKSTHLDYSYLKYTLVVVFFHGDVLIEESARPSQGEKVK